jgi:DNA-directed RNA polymerase specialized sigma subunit
VPPADDRRRSKPELNEDVRRDIADSVCRSQEVYRRFTMFVADKDIPSVEELLSCLQLALEKLELRLNREYPTHAVQHGIEHAWNRAIDAICDGRAQRMTAAARRSWLSIIARHATVTVLRKKKIVSLMDDEIPSQSETCNDFQRELVLKAVYELPADARALIEALYIEGLTARAAAERLSISSQTTFRVRRFRAILMLRKIFEQLDENNDSPKNTGTFSSQRVL